jgi:uncharacterized lipoprotein YmbA
MKQAVLDLKSFVVRPSKKTLRRHKRIVGTTVLNSAKNAEKKRNLQKKEREQHQTEYDEQVQLWADYLSSSDVVDQQSKNPKACFEAFGPAPCRLNAFSKFNDSR